MTPKAIHQLKSGLERSAADIATGDQCAAEAVRSKFMSLLKLGDQPGIPEFLAGVVHADLGQHAATVVWRTILEPGILLSSGLPGTGDASPGRFSFAAACLVYGTVRTLHATVMRGIPDAVQPSLRPETRSQWLDLLCTNRFEREHPAYDSVKHELNLIYLAASNADDMPQRCAEAFELAWEVDRGHYAFEEVGGMASETGAHVRSFLLSKVIAETSVGARQAAPITTHASTRPRSRRAL